MLKAFLMRHGEPDWRTDNIPLSVVGKHQARLAAKMIIDSGIDRDVSLLMSPQNRALQSGNLLAELFLGYGYRVTSKIDRKFGDENSDTAIGVLNAITEVDKRFQTLIIIGHKDSVRPAIRKLTGTDPGSLAYAQPVRISGNAADWRSFAFSTNNKLSKYPIPAL